MEKTLVIIKPDAVKKKLIGRILGIYEENGLYVDKMYMTNATEAILAEHYAEHVERDFYPKLVQFMLSGPMVVMQLSGEMAISKTRKINGATNPAKADVCTIRYLYGESVTVNCVHASANAEDALRELDIWFKN